MPRPSEEQVAALLSKYKAITERVVKERDAYKLALDEIQAGLFCDQSAGDWKRRYEALQQIARSALTRPNGGRGS